MGRALVFLRRAIGLLEDLEADVTGGDFTQRQHRDLVVRPFERRLGPVRELAGALRGHQHQLEQVGNVLQAVFDGDAGHGRSVGEMRDKGRKHSTGGPGARQADSG